MTDEGKNWKGDNLVEIFLKNQVDDHIPRKITSDVPGTVTHGYAMTVQKTELLPRVMQKLSVEGFLACPVMDGTTYVGFISMLDLVRYTSNLFWGETEAEWVDFWDKSDDFKSSTVDDVMKRPDIWSRDPSPPTRLEYSTLHCLETFAHTRLHRMVVLNDMDEVRSVITESMIISFLRQNRSKLPRLMAKSVSSIMELSESKLFTVNHDDKAITAFNTMADQSLSGLPMVDDDGVLVGTISIRDLRGVGTRGQLFSRLFKPAKEFKRLSRQDYPKQAPRTHWSNKRVPLKALFVMPDDSLGEVIYLMNDGNIHRVWVCEDATRPVPIGVISQRDVCMTCVTALQDWNWSFKGPGDDTDLSSRTSATSTTSSTSSTATSSATRSRTAPGTSASKRSRSIPIG